MAIDTTIQFNDHNSYKITTPLFCYPFGVEGMSYITHSFQAYATSSLSSANRAKTKFFASDGSLVSEVNHAFAVTTVFGKIEITVAVPATAKQAQLVLVQGGTDWWIAEPKTEQGEVATPYNVNYQGQLTYITPNGIYTGMMTTGQIVVTGSVSSPDETLDTRLVTINNGVINLSSTLSAKTTKITNEGVYTGEVRADQITVGQIQGPQLADGSVSDVKIASGLSATKITTGKLQSVNGKTYFDLTNAEIKQTATISGHNIVVTLSPTKGIELTSDAKKLFGIDGDGKAFVTRMSDPDNPRNFVDFGAISGVTGVAQSFWSKFDTDPRERLRIRLVGITATQIYSVPYDETGDNGTGSTQLYVGQGVANAVFSDYLHNASLSYGNNSVGADSTGPYYVKAGTKHYF